MSEQHSIPDSAVEAAAKMERTFRYRLYPTRGQAAALNAQLDFNCALYNAALEQRRTAWRDFGAPVSCWEQSHELTQLRKELGPEGMNYACQQMALQRLDRAFKAFFRRVKGGEKPGFPRFRARARYRTLTWRPKTNGGAAIVNGRLRLQGIGHIKVKWHRDLQGEPKQVRVTEKNGRWYVALSVEVERAPLPVAGGEVGVDLGIRRFATLSDGSHIAGPRPGRVAAPTIRRAQRKVARRQRGSHRRRRAVGELARRREKEANRRLDAAHKAARSLVDQFDLIAVEDLRLRNMVRGNRGLAREISDQGWSTFLKCLDEKAESAARQVIRVNPRHTSQRCHECGTVDRDSRRGPRFCCTACGHTDDADVNAARNILASARTEPSGANPQHVRGLPEKPRQGVVTPTRSGPTQQSEGSKT